MPLIAGVLAALLFANVDSALYNRVVHEPVSHIFSGAYSADASHQIVDSEHEDPHTDRDAANGHSTVHTDEQHHSTAHGWEHYLTLHFWINDIFMVLFFGIAAKEITEACLPNGALNPVSKAINPILGTIGGIVGPVATFLVLNATCGDASWTNGWGIPTATDIALAWLVARIVFGKGHPAISFLLLLAVADDAIGLGIIAIAYPDPSRPTLWLNALWVIPAMGIAWGLRRARVQSWIPYIAIAGSLSWWALFSAHLHPALALVFIVPFLPGPTRDLGLFEEEADYDAPPSDVPNGQEHHHSPLESFEHQTKLFVDFGLFFFAFANAGVPLSGISGLTWIILASLAVGKTVGITAFSWAGHRLGFPLPTGMGARHLITAGLIGGIGLTVALFVSGQAFQVAETQGAAKMGALFSAGLAIVAILIGRALHVNDMQAEDEESLDACPDPYEEGVVATAGQSIARSASEQHEVDSTVINP